MSGLASTKKTAKQKYCPKCSLKMNKTNTNNMMFVAEECHKHKQVFVSTSTGVMVQEKFLTTFILMTTVSVINCYQ